MPNWCNNDTEITGPREDLEAILAVINADERDGLLIRLRPMPEEFESNWWDWQYENWGTKWGDKETEITPSLDHNQISIRYETPWGPLSAEFWQHVSTQYPTLSFKTVWSEPNMGIAGATSVSNGAIHANIQMDIVHPEVDDDDEDYSNPEAEAEDELWAKIS